MNHEPAHSEVSGTRSQEFYTVLTAVFPKKIFVDFETARCLMSAALALFLYPAVFTVGYINRPTS